MTIIRVNLHDNVNGRNNIATFNNVEGAIGTGVLVADCLDITGVATGVTLVRNGNFTAQGGASGIATVSPDADFPPEFFQGYHYANSTDVAGATLTHGNLPPGAAYTLKLAGHSSNADRDTDFFATGGTPSPAFYDNIASTTPTTPVTITGTVPGNGEITISTALYTFYSFVNGWQLEYADGPVIQTLRKSSAFDIETTLGTITTATLNSVNVFDHVTGQVGTTVSFEGAATDEITTSGEYTLTLGDGVGTEDITVQVNVYGVAPSNNPLQKDGSALASLTGVQVRVTDGANLNGTELEYLPTATTDASGNLGNIDLSSTAAAVDDSVLLHMRTSSGDSIISDETVELL